MIAESSHELLSLHCAGKLAAREFLERKQPQLKERRRGLALAPNTGPGCLPNAGGGERCMGEPERTPDVTLDNFLMNPSARLLMSKAVVR